MQSFRTELEQSSARARRGGADLKKAIVEKDILDLGQKIEAFKGGSLHEDKFRAIRLARGVYGQRQQGVQMIRIKLPFGKVTTAQLRRIASVSDEYSTGHLHITTRQDVQIHYVSLDRTPQLWADLERDDVTLREACGNTVRNVTASAIAGIDPNELFDVSPYADLVFRYFLRKPFGQELGRKIKIAFSSSENDDAFTFIHDFGFIPKIKVENNIEVKGFKVLVGGGLGAQPFLASVAYEFLPADEIIPFIEASIRVFDRHGERNSRNKARMKYLIQRIGFEAFLQLVAEERLAIQYDAEKDFALVAQETCLNTISHSRAVLALPPSKGETASSLEKREYTLEDQAVAPGGSRRVDSVDELAEKDTYSTWFRTNVFPQKQQGYVGVFLKVLLGNFNTDQARKLADIAERYAADDIRFTIDQSILLKFVNPELLPELYNELKEIGLADSGYDSLADITACPGTDTCNLGISNSTDVSAVIEQTIREEYPGFLFNRDIKIKISGCMNSCGQHGLAHIGFHGSSVKVGQATAPALQVLLGGGKTGNGHGRIAEKVIKLPSKRVLDCIRYLLNDYLEFGENDEAFNDYYDRQGNKYFYDLLKPLADTSTLKPEDFIDWGQNDDFKTAIGVGECAGVMIDLVATLIFDSEEKIDNAAESLAEQRFADAIYHSYAAGVNAAKAILLDSKVRCNTQQGIIDDFDKHLGATFGFTEENSFADLILQIRKEEPSERLAYRYFGQVKELIGKIKVRKQDAGNR